MDTSIALFRSSNGLVVVYEIIDFVNDGIVHFKGRLSKDSSGKVGTYVAYLSDLEIVHSHV